MANGPPTGERTSVCDTCGFSTALNKLYEVDDGHSSDDGEGAESDHETRESWANTTQKGVLKSEIQNMECKVSEPRKRSKFRCSRDR